jgi:pSer/pThr/pTyr-binding forkhead associated (FHA) protein
MKATFLVFDARSSNPQELVLELPVTIGRSADADICLQDSWASRSHCQIDAEDGVLVVRDLSSKHGTMVNRQPISESGLLPEDELLIGLTSMRVSLETSCDDSMLELSTA